MLEEAPWGALTWHSILYCIVMLFVPSLLRLSLLERAHQRQGGDRRRRARRRSAATSATTPPQPPHAPLDTHRSRPQHYSALQPAPTIDSRSAQACVLAPRRVGESRRRWRELLRRQ